MHVCDQFAASGRAFAYSTDFIFIFGGSGVNKRVGSGVYGKNQKEQLRREPALACSCGLLRWVVQLMDSIYQQLIEMGKLGFHYPRGMELVPRRLMIRVASVPWPGRHEMPTSPPATRAYRRAIGNPTPYPENLAPKFLL